MSDGNGQQSGGWFQDNAPAVAATAPQKAAPAATPVPASQTAPAKTGGDWFAANKPPAPPPAKEDPGFFAKAWDWATKPIMSRGHFLAGVLTGNPNDEDVAGAIDTVLDKAKKYSTSAPTGFDVNHPVISAMLKGYAGAESDAADVAASTVSPVGIATIGASGAAEVPGAVGTIAKAGLGTASAGFTGKGAVDIAQAGTSNTPQGWQQRLTGAAEIAGGAAGVGESVKSAVSNPLAKTMDTPRGSTPPENFTPAEVKAYADANGIPLTAAQVTENVGARAVQSSGERAVVGGSDVKAGIKASQDAVTSHAEDMANSFSPNTPDLASRGAAIQQNVQNALDAQLTKADANYTKVDSYAQGTTVDLKSVKQTADRVLSDTDILQKANIDPKTATKVLKGIDSLDDNASFSDSQKLRSALLDLSRSPELAISTTAQGMLKQVIGATDQAMMDAAQGTPELQKAFRDANSHYERIQDDLNSPRSPLNQILAEPDPSKVPQKLTAKGQIGGSPYNAGLLDTYGIDKGPIKATITQDLLSRNFGMYGKSLGGYSDAFLQSIFTPEELSDLYKTGVIARSVGLNTNPSGTAAVSSAIEQTKHPFLSAVPQAVAAKLTTNPHFNNWLTERGVVPPVRKGAAVAAVASGGQGEQ